MYTTFLIILNKFISFICRIFRKNGSVFPGSIIYRLDNHILKKIKYPSLVIGITGSSGKGSTIELAAHIMESSGLRVCWNKSGSNGIHAITTLILNNTRWNHSFKYDVLLVELDERHIKLAFEEKILTHLLITNITRDQPPRNTHPDIIFKDIFTTIDDYTHLIINADDAVVNRIKLSHTGKVTTYGIDKTTDSYSKPAIKSVDCAYCPICNKKLKYEYYHYGHLGKYECPKCHYGRGIVNFEATDVNLDKKTIKINNKEINLNKNILYTAYCTTAAYALCNTIGIPEEKILLYLNVEPIPPKRGKIYSLGKRNVNMLESKNENALSYYQSLRYITNQKGEKTIILGFDNVSRRYQYNDLSWLWDVEFELFNTPKINKIICIGRFKYDVATRLAYAGIKEEKLILVDNINDLMNITKAKSKGEIFTMVCFDMSTVIKNLLKGETENGKN